jgi:exodeoxyribonuclease VII large subunit
MKNRTLLNRAINHNLRLRVEIIQDYKKRQSKLNKEMISGYYNHSININNTQKSIKKVLKSKLISQIETLSLKKQQIKQINPDLLLRKGYAIVRNNNKIVKSINDISSQSDIEIQVCDGLIKAEIKE